MDDEKKIISIQEYTVTKELTNEHSGFAKWGFAKKNGTEYFIKEFLSPIWPEDTAALTEKQKQNKIDDCNEWFNRKSKLYDAIRKSSNGNIIVPNDLFRFKSHYYLITDKVDTCSLSIEEIAALDTLKQLIILKVLAHCLNQLSVSGIVHSDLKPDNLLIKKTVSGMYTVKLIDFDSSFLESDIPCADEIQCDPTYMSPETFLYMIGEKDSVDHKSDIFSAGLIIHQFICGELPLVSDEYDYVYEAVLDGGPVVFNENIPLRLRQIIEKMLEPEPSERLSSEDMYRLLLHSTLMNINSDLDSPEKTKKTDEKAEEKPEGTPKEKPNAETKNVFRPATDEDW